MVTFHSSNIHQTCDFSTLEDKLEAKPVQFSASLFITLGFRCMKICHSGHPCYPPKFVFLQTEPKPPWTPPETRYTAMSLEDKARFQARSIDTHIKTKSLSLVKVEITIRFYECLSVRVLVFRLVTSNLSTLWKFMHAYFPFVSQWVKYALL